jgi:putative inorganic carbon (HCO3(-)) transporter
VRASRGKPELQWAFWLVQMTKVSIVAYLVGGAFQNLAYWDMPYYLFVAVAVTRWAVRNPIVEEQTAPAASAAPGIAGVTSRAR